VSASLEIRADGAEDVELAIAGLASRLRNLHPLMLTVGAYVESSTRERFETNIGPSGERWKPSLAAKLRGGPTLVEYGRLRGSITHVAGETEVEVGTNVIYAGPHQFGATIVPKKAKALRFRLPGGGFVTARKVTLPARPFLGLSVIDRAEIVALAGEHLDGAGA
jgi:phage virion morphogenesis protein